MREQREKERDESMAEASDSFRFSPISLLLLDTVHSLDACRANTSRQKKEKEKEKKRSLCCKYNFICTSREIRCVLSEHAIGHVRSGRKLPSRLSLRSRNLSSLVCSVRSYNH